MKLTRGLLVVTVTTLYLGVAFRLFEDAFWTRGLGDWWDPYFINFVLEHWYSSARRLSDPTSPPMFFPAEGTLGYSHGLILYVPFYAIARGVLHPFQAYNLTLFLVFAGGSWCLYAFLRRFLRLTWAESLLVTLFFLTSPNVMGPWMGVWSQRGSVFLVPAVLYVAFASWTMPPGRRRLLAALAAGFLWMLLYTQDFYTGHFVVFFAAIAGLAWLALHWREVAERSLAFWRVRRPLSVYVALAIVALAGMWTLFIAVSGGGGISFAGIAVSSRDWRRPAILVLAALTFLMTRPAFRVSWLLPFLTGAFAGGCVFLWIYLDAYRAHHGFPDAVIAEKLRPFGGDVRGGYESLRSFLLLGLLALAGWIPRAGASGPVRRLSVAAVAVAFAVLAIPFRIGSFSIWLVMRDVLPGFSSISDPTRIIYIFELAAALWAGWFISRLQPASLLRRSAAALILLLVAVRPNIVVFDFLRPRETYARWVEAPVMKDPSCRSFVIKAASAAYGERPNNAWTTYPMDAMWVALHHSIPTLNGYSAWAPPGYSIGNPHDAGYESAVDAWIAHRSLSGVCVFDIEQHTMTPRQPPR